MKFLHSFQSEWLKKRRSLASWLVVIGAFFTPLIVLTSRIYDHSLLFKSNVTDDFWIKHWNQSWESMEVFLLPIGIILATGLIAQIEYKNNTWKQLHTTPQSYTTAFFAKFSVILIMLLQVFILFNLGVFLSAVIPSLIFSGVPYPAAHFPLGNFLQANLVFFIDCLPIVALQFLISLQFKNFLVPVGAGFAIWFLGVGLLSGNYSYLFPYNHGAISFLKSTGKLATQTPVINIEYLALIYFLIFIAAGWFLYVNKTEKG